MIFIATCGQDARTDLSPPFFDAVHISVSMRTDPIAMSDFHPTEFRITTSPWRVTQSTLLAFYLRKPLYEDKADIPKGGCLECWRLK